MGDPRNQYQAPSWWMMLHNLALFWVDRLANAFFSTIGVVAALLVLKKLGVPFSFL